MLTSKVTFKEGKGYPYIGVFSGPDVFGLTVLFTSRNTGICLCEGGGGNYIGEWGNDWTEKHFSRLAGTVTITQEG